MQSISHYVAGWSPQGMMPYLQLGVGFSCCKICLSVIAVTMLALVSGSLCLFMCSLGNDRDDGLTRLSVHSLGHPIYLIIDLLRWSDLLMSICMGPKNLPFFTHSVRPIHALLPQMSWSPSSITLFPCSWPSSQPIGYSPWTSEQ